MNDERKVYNGVTSLKKALRSIVMIGSDGKPPRPMTIKERNYRRLCSWMGKYSGRIVLDEKGKIKEVKGKPVFPTERELREELGMTCGQLRSVAKQNYDIGAAFHWKGSVDEEVKRQMSGKYGLETGVTYVALDSQYPFLTKVFGKKE